MRMIFKQNSLSNSWECRIDGDYTNGAMAKFKCAPFSTAYLNMRYKHNFYER